MISFRPQELFVEYLAKEAYERTAQGKRKTIQKKDLGMLFEFANSDSASHSHAI